MIVFDLICSEDAHRFEAWFRSSQDFAMQQAEGLLVCPQCGGNDVAKAATAPAVGRKGNQTAAVPSSEQAPAPAPAASVQPAGERVVSAANLSPEAREALTALAQMQKKALEGSKYVGGRFADEARAMHYGDAEPTAIHGEASIEQAEELADEGIEIAALPFPVAPPDAVN